LGIAHTNLPRSARWFRKRDEAGDSNEGATNDIEEAKEECPHWLSFLRGFNA
jgi:hypothetical protein